MAWFFGDSFDPYAAPADAYAGGTYWDTGVSSFSLVPGRFAGSRAVQFLNTVITLQKASGSNDGVHHFNLAAQQTGALTGSSLCFIIRLMDGATVQCCIVFRSDGSIVLTSGVHTGTVLATYTSAVSAINTWYGYEIEVVVHNTTGSIAVRRNGNTVNDFSATGLNTRGGTSNNYANQITLGQNTSQGHHVDDFLWRSDAASVPWAGELRCYTRMPASDATVQWTPSGAVVPTANFSEATTGNLSLGATARYLPFVAPCDGTVATLSMQCTGAVTADIKCSIYASAAGAATAVLGSAGVVSNPGIGTTTWTFATPVPVTRGTTYYAAFCATASSGTFAYVISPIATYTPLVNTSNYAAFPATNPGSLSAGNNYKVTINITPTAAVNAPFVADTQQDAAASYVASSTVGQTDLYNIAPISGTPTGIVGVTTRALVQKSDAGTRNIALKLKSGATDVTGTSTPLNTTFGWVYRNDVVDPATGAAWTPVGVNNLQIGETLVA